MSVLEAVLRLKELDQAKQQQDQALQQQIFQSGLNSLLQVNQAAQENKQKSALMQIESQKAQAEINKSMEELKLKSQSNDMISNLLNGQGVGGQGAGGQGAGGARVKGMTLDTGAGNVNVEFPQTDAEIQRGIDVKARTATAEKAAKGVDPSLAGKYANIESAVGHKDELMGLLYPKNSDGSYDTTQFNPDIKGLSPFKTLTPKYQRLHELLKDVDTAHKLTLTTRAISGDVETVKGGSLSDLNLTTNPQAFAQKLNNFFDTADTALKSINPNYKSNATQRFVVNGKPYDIPADKVDEFKKDMGL